MTSTELGLGAGDLRIQLEVYHQHNSPDTLITENVGQSFDALQAINKATDALKARREKAQREEAIGEFLTAAITTLPDPRRTFFDPKNPEDVALARRMQANVIWTGFIESEYIAGVKENGRTTDILLVPPYPRRPQPATEYPAQFHIYTVETSSFKTAMQTVDNSTRQNFSADELVAMSRGGSDLSIQLHERAPNSIRLEWAPLEVSKKVQRLQRAEAKSSVRGWFRYLIDGDIPEPRSSTIIYKMKLDPHKWITLNEKIISEFGVFGRVAELATSLGSTEAVQALLEDS